MEFDFDAPVNIRGAHSAKWDMLAAATGITPDDDVIPMWIADMDFAAPQFVRDAVVAEAERGFLGYYGSTQSWREALLGWLDRRHDWRPDADSVITTPGIMVVLALAIQKYSSPGDHVVLFSPVYHEFSKLIRANDRCVHNQPMLVEQGRFRMDVEGLARDMPKNAKIVVLCSPHNPGGRVWTAEEIRAVADFCIERNLILVSDEIHYDLVYPGNRHIPTAVAAPQVHRHLITIVGATKSFNIAGTKIGAAIIPDPELRSAIASGIRALGTGSPNRFGMAATEAANRSGDAWMDALIHYLETNRDLFIGGIATAIPGCRPMPMEATYLSWVDFSDTGLSGEDVMERLKRSRIGVSAGPPFGPGGERGNRFNIATPRHRLEQALSRMEDVFSDLR